MSELIDRHAAIEAADSVCKAWRGIFRDVKAKLEQIPAVDAVEVRHGHWRIGNRTNVYGGREIICSQCGESFMVSPKTLEYLSDCERFCCRCGAKMEVEHE